MAVSLLGVVAVAAGGVDPSADVSEGADVPVDAGVGTTGRGSSVSPSDGGIPVRRYSTARSGLL